MDFESITLDLAMNYLEAIEIHATINKILGECTADTQHHGVLAKAKFSPFFRGSERGNRNREF
jgi:hypothetical protein